MKNKRKIIGCLVLCLFICALVLLTAKYIRSTKPRREDGFLRIDHNSFELHGQRYFTDDSYDPTEHWPYVRNEWPSSCYLASNPDAGYVLQALDDNVEKFRAIQKAAPSPPPSKRRGHLHDVRINAIEFDPRR